MKDDHEGIAIYKSDDSTGYLLVSNQQANTFMVYSREDTSADPHRHERIAEVPVSTVECDGAGVTAVNLGSRFPTGDRTSTRLNSSHYYAALMPSSAST